MVRHIGEHDHLIVVGETAKGLRRAWQGPLVQNLAIEELVDQHQTVVEGQRHVRTVREDRALELIAGQFKPVTDRR